MANIFTKSNDATPKPNRNTFDGSFVNNLTLKMGQITPCFCKEVIPGDSFRINPTFGFNFQPFVFPVQTDMQANLHFFYVRNRSLWKGWMDFITKTENLDGDSTPPYILLNEENRDMFDTGKIGDYLGVPTIFYGSSEETYFFTYASYYDDIQSRFYATSMFSETYVETLLSNLAVDAKRKGAIEGLLTNIFVTEFGGAYKHTSILTPTDGVGWSQFYYQNLPPNTYSTTIGTTLIRNAFTPSYGTIDGTMYIHVMFNPETGKVFSYLVQKNTGTSFQNVGYYKGEYSSTGGKFTFLPDVEEIAAEKLAIASFFTQNTGASSVTSGFNGVQNLSAKYDASYGIPNSERELADLPFESTPTSGGDKVRISALPFRAVEACYNAFYRDDRNNPLIIDGKPYYNVYVQNKNGGADTTHYHLYQRNWEADVFTTAVQSPQQGVAPLVGITASGEMTFQDDNGDTYVLIPQIDKDGTTITGIKSYSSDMPAGTLRAMVDTISTGISINDFRNVNALQRWLETNMRKGLRYKDQIEAHFGTSPTYSELEMPEFIGGMSRRVEVNKVVQTSADTAGSPLGTLGGNATILGGNGSDISCYADEHGWIIGFITITPKPVYSQQLNKQLTKTQLLEYYFPEFAHAPFQPILNQEIAPLQCRGREGERLTDVFGYQRAWYEYLANVDEVHGDFRTSLKDYIIHRVFNGVPQLSEEFLTVSTDEANEVFASRNDDDKIFGQIYFDVKMKRPIPTIGVPKLEVG